MPDAIELSVLRLLPSVTTMAEGKREGWEYWGGSCLWGYTAEGKTEAEVRRVTERVGCMQIIIRLKFQLLTGYASMYVVH